MSQQISGKAAAAEAIIRDSDNCVESSSLTDDSSLNLSHRRIASSYWPSCKYAWPSLMPMSKCFLSVLQLTQQNTGPRSRCELQFPFYRVSAHNVCTAQYCFANSICPTAVWCHNERTHRHIYLTFSTGTILLILHSTLFENS